MNLPGVLRRFRTGAMAMAAVFLAGTAAPDIA